MNTCEGYEELISAFIDGMLSDRDRLALMEHMAHCSACQNYFNEQIAIHDAVMDDMDSMRVPDGFAGTVMERVRTTPQNKKTGKPFLHWRQWAALAACCLLAALGLWKIGPVEDTSDMQVVSQPAPESAVTTGISGSGAAPYTAADSGEPLSMPETEQTMPKVRNSGAASQTQAAPTAEAGKSADAAPEYPAEFAALPSDPEAGTALLDDAGGFPVQTSYAGILTTASPLAAAWVEENLDSVWIAGACYEMNAGEYQALKEFLSAQDAVFSETAGPAGSEGFLLVAAD
ncbi:MAG: zf-HC2 domain-containing protein [Oscillospiraceae bacterium]|nr:zf-HC2 domain-containing protein [Oscillospiraceae bacterium]